MTSLLIQGGPGRLLDAQWEQTRFHLHTATALLVSLEPFHGTGTNPAHQGHLGSTQPLPLTSPGVISGVQSKDTAQSHLMIVSAAIVGDF